LAGFQGSPEKYRSQMRFVRSHVLSPQDVVDRTREDIINEKKSGVARFERLVIKLTCCIGMGGLRKEILQKLYVANQIFARVKGVAQYCRLLITEVRVLFRAVARS
jgi:hypothetical protein